MSRQFCVIPDFFLIFFLGGITVVYMAQRLGWKDLLGRGGVAYGAVAVMCCLAPLSDLWIGGIVLTVYFLTFALW